MLGRPSRNSHEALDTRPTTMTRRKQSIAARKHDAPVRTAEPPALPLPTGYQAFLAKSTPEFKGR